MASDALNAADSPRPPAFVRAVPGRAQRALRGMIGSGRFTKRDVCYEHRIGRVTIGLWLLDRAAAEYVPHFWPIRRATLHWRRHDVVVDKVLNFEFQIDEEGPFAELSAIAYEPNLLTFIFGDAMKIAVGISELSLTCRRSETVRTDWGVAGWTFALATRPPALTTRGT